MSNETVNLAALTGEFKKVALKLGWCGQAEEYFEKATGVKMLEPERVFEPCLPICGRGHSRTLHETRFRLPVDAPKTVLLAPIIEALKQRWDDIECDLCCEDCRENYSEEFDALKRLACAIEAPDIFA